MPQTPGTDWLAIILIGGGSSHGRGATKEDAIQNAIHYLRDWETLFKVANREVILNVYDVSGYAEIHWDHDGIVGVNCDTGKREKIERPAEHVRRTTPKWKKRA